VDGTVVVFVVAYAEIEVFRQGARVAAWSCREVVGDCDGDGNRLPAMGNGQRWCRQSVFRARPPGSSGVLPGAAACVVIGSDGETGRDGGACLGFGEESTGQRKNARGAPRTVGTDAEGGRRGKTGGKAAPRHGQTRGAGRAGRTVFFRPLVVEISKKI
jgi:hypothetical protein